MKGERVVAQRDAEPPEKVAVRERNDPGGIGLPRDPRCNSEGRRRKSGTSGSPRSVTHSAWSGIGSMSAGVRCASLMYSALLWMTVRSAPRSFASKFFVYR